jgi:hypothetical protein
MVKFSARRTPGVEFLRNSKAAVLCLIDLLEQL